MKALQLKAPATLQWRVEKGSHLCKYSLMQQPETKFGSSWFQQIPKQMWRNFKQNGGKTGHHSFSYSVFYNLSLTSYNQLTTKNGGGKYNCPLKAEDVNYVLKYLNLSNRPTQFTLSFSNYNRANKRRIANYFDHFYFSITKC